MKVLLASESPRRKELLKEIFSEFDITSPIADENYVGDTPEDTVKEIAKRKVIGVNGEGYDLIIASDTLVYLDGRYLGKPKDSNEAKEMLSFLSGKTHKVVSGIALKNKEGIKVISDTAYVTFRDLSAGDIDNYTKKFNLLDKAGSYAIQDNVTVLSYSGDFTTIMGLPITALRKMLKEMGCKG